MWHAWEGRENVQVFGGKARSHSEDRSVNGRAGSEWIFGILSGSVEWLQLAPDRDRSRGLVNAVLNLSDLARRN
jgi:hypothetical protein